MAQLFLDAPILDLPESEHLKNYRANYQKYRMGSSFGAKGEINFVEREGSKAGESARWQKWVESKGDSTNDLAGLDAEEEPESEGAYALARDVKIPDHVVQTDRPLKATFERAKKMRSEVIVESGIIDNLAARMPDVIPEICHRSPIYVVTDAVTDELFAQKVFDGLESAGLNVTKFIVESSTDASGENSTEGFKTLDTFAALTDQILAAGVDKRTCIVSVGGGVINNICGFIAGSIYRGVTLIHFSTTMMGQVDAAIDFKQALNHSCGKNLIGCYYPATRIVLDPECLATQSKRHLRNGLAEALKHGIVHSTDLLEFILSDDGSGAEYREGYLDGVVRRTISVKVPTLTRYEESDFNEMAPQFGHAPAHAVEFLSWHGGYDCEPILHGEAVAIGMCVSAEVALIMGVCNAEAVEDIYNACTAVGLPTTVPKIMDLDEVCAKLAYDKHTLSGKPTMGLMVALGDMYHEDGTYGIAIDADVLRKAFEINQNRGSA
mmetsp:Transcript_8853/g.31187  ORF Transcript_8853/g.31187 Transcript_8853/m.31187 type:complete len:494 (+) Transcript_8853:120-1601(+)